MEIKGHKYYYLVRSVRVGKAVRQEVVRYFGRDREAAYEWLDRRSRGKVITTR